MFSFLVNGGCPGSMGKWLSKKDIWLPANRENYLGRVSMLSVLEIIHMGLSCIIIHPLVVRIRKESEQMDRNKE